MAKRTNITEVANFKIQDESNWHNWHNWKQSFGFYLSVSGTDDDSQMRALLIHCPRPDVQDIFMH